MSARPLQIVCMCTAAVVAAAVLTVTELSLTASPARAAGPLERPDEVSALALARSSGERVEVTSARSETQTIWVKPDGSRTAEISARPTRVRTMDGWAPVDTTLVRRADGSVTSRATAAELAFSGGGSGPAATVKLGRSELSLGWEQDLPAPEISGSTATYRNILPDVDLQVTAGVDGFSQILVVHSPEAAASPELAELRFDLDTVGVTPELDEAGNLRAVGRDGESVVFHAAAPRMWEAQGSMSAGATDSGARESLHQPAVGAETAKMGIALDEDGTGDWQLVIRPDEEMLHDPNVNYPLVLDPSVSVGRPAWTYVNREFPNQSYYNSGDADTGIGYEPEQGSTKRAFWRFMVADRTVGATIHSATFRASVTHAFDCTDASVELWLTSQISSSTTWNNQPNWARRLDTRNVNIGRADCPGSGVEFDATDAYRDGAAENWNTIVLALKGNETVSDGNGDWRRFDADPVLVVEYNHPPEQPFNLRDELGGECSTDWENPPRINDPAPWLAAWIDDPDQRFESGTKLRAQFQWAIGSGELGGFITTPFAGIGESGREFRVDMDSNPIPEGRTLGWRVRGGDESGAVGPFSQWCYINVDTTNPASPAASSQEYPDDETEHGGVGSPGTFTLTARSGDTTRFHYGFNDNTCAQTVAADSLGGQATIRHVPIREGINQLYAFAEDQAGNASQECLVVHNFLVAPPADPIAHFTFNDGEGTSAADSAESGRSAAFSSGVTWTRGRIGHVPSTGGVPRFDGAAGHFSGADGVGASTTGPVVDTSKAFSVGAWVRLGQKGRNYTAVGEDADPNSGFYLGYRESTGGWAFVMPDTNAGATGWAQADSTNPARTGVWTHLMGTFDPVAKRVTLYVNGVKQGTDTNDKLGQWSAGGGLQIGRAKYGGGYVDEWPGDIDDVRVYDRVISDQPTVFDETTSEGVPESRELWRLVTRPYQLQAHYPLHNPDFTPLTGTEAPDVSDNGLTATLHGDPAQVWTQEASGNQTPGGHFNGTTDYVDTAGPAIRTDQPYTVTAWVRLGDPSSHPDPDRWVSALTQSGERNSGFYLQFAPKVADPVDAPRYWAMVTRLTDTDHAVTPRAFSDSTAEIGVWTHLTGSYDPIDRRLTIWVNGVRQGSRILDEPLSWNAAGPVQIARMKINGLQDKYWPGDIDDVHLYQGVLSDLGVASTMTNGTYPAMTG